MMFVSLVRMVCLCRRLCEARILDFCVCKAGDEVTDAETMETPLIYDKCMLI